jgi:hypothetical protein
MQETSKHARIVAHLKKRTSHAREKLSTHYPHVERKLKSLNLDLSDVRRHSAKVLSTAALASGMMMASPMFQSTIFPTHEESPLSKRQLEEHLSRELSKILPQKIEALSPEAEDQASKTIASILGIKATASLDGNHLNTSFGYIGAEQHMPRYPGDTIYGHDLQSKGITPGLGAFGYFTISQNELTEEDILKEKYYVAVQTLYLPNWKKDHKWLKDWYKFRKVLVVNPKNGKSVIAVIGDAGPAAWTGKQFGGSPELMATLELKDGRQKGGVLIFFLDDQDNPIALGPVDMKLGRYLAER